MKLPRKIKVEFEGKKFRVYPVAYWSRRAKFHAVTKGEAEGIYYAIYVNGAFKKVKPCR